MAQRDLAYFRTHLLNRAGDLFLGRDDSNVRALYADYWYIEEIFMDAWDGRGVGQDELTVELYAELLQGWHDLVVSGDRSLVGGPDVVPMWMLHHHRRRGGMGGRSAVKPDELELVLSIMLDEMEALARESHEWQEPLSWSNCAFALCCLDDRAEELVDLLFQSANWPKGEPFTSFVYAALAGDGYLSPLVGEGPPKDHPDWLPSPRFAMERRMVRDNLRALCARANAQGANQRSQSSEQCLARVLESDEAFREAMVELEKIMDGTWR